MDVVKLLSAMPSLHASDLHLQVDSPPCFRVNGDIAPADIPPISGPEMRELLAPVLDETRPQAPRVRPLRRFRVRRRRRRPLPRYYLL